MFRFLFRGFFGHVLLCVHVRRPVIRAAPTGKLSNCAESCVALFRKVFSSIYSFKKKIPCTDVLVSDNVEF